MSGVIAHLQQTLRAAGGWLGFDDYLQIALHHPQYGYYGSGRIQFGGGGDFYTAPTLSPLFGEVIAAQLAPVLAACGGGILELGGGDGDLAAHILSAPSCANTPYTILETSTPLRTRQQHRLRDFKTVQWTTTLPPHHDGVILANEVLDCVPFRLFVKREAAWQERGIAENNGEIVWQEKPPTDTAWQKLTAFDLPDGYQTEVCPQAIALTQTLVRTLRRGCVLLIDYGFKREEFYHPQRTEGTMMCHHRQRADANPLNNIGDKDITAHIDFTDIAEAGIAAGGALLGYTTQAHFLVGGGITDRLAAYQDDALAYAKLAAGANKLLLPHEMGELFKCIAFGKGDIPPLTGFA